MSSFLFLRQILAANLGPKARSWFKEASAELANGVANRRFSALLALASRHARRTRLELSAAELAQAEKALPGWNPERWNLLEVLRVALILSRCDLGADTAVLALDEAFQFADEGELCALYRSLAHLPAGERFVWRAGEGCRSNMVSVFEAVALDTPYPREHFDDLAWNQAAVKALFIGAPLWRLAGLDERLNEDLARMTLDLAEERRSAGRPVQPELWLCLGTHGGERGLASLLQELDSANPHRRGRRAAAYGLARAGEGDRLAALREGEADPAVKATMSAALDGPIDQTVFRPLSTETPSDS